MGFKAKEFLDDFGIFWTERGKHARPGWVQIECPFCTGNPGYHGGFNVEGGYYNCWRCDYHSIIQVIKALTRRNDSFQILKKYSDGEFGRYVIQQKNFATKIEMPEGCQELSGPYRDYLFNKGFHPDELQFQYNIKQSDNFSAYKYRIMIPIYIGNKLVSYVGRDITDLAASKYMSAPSEEEVHPHQFVLYGLNKCYRKVGMVVEGPSDVWRMGNGSVGTFGIKFSRPQIMQMVQRFKKLFIFYDDDPQAQKQADKMEQILKSFLIDVEILELDEGDPGALQQSEANYIMRHLGIRK